MSHYQIQCQFKQIKVSPKGIVFIASMSQVKI